MKSVHPTTCGPVQHSTAGFTLKDENQRDIITISTPVTTSLYDTGIAPVINAHEQTSKAEV